MTAVDSCACDVELLYPPDGRFHMAEWVKHWAHYLAALPAEVREAWESEQLDRMRRSGVNVDALVVLIESGPY